MKKRILSTLLALLIALSCAPLAGAAVSSSDAQAYYQLCEEYYNRTPYLIDFDRDGQDELILVWDHDENNDLLGDIQFEVWSGSKKICPTTTSSPWLRLCKNTNTPGIAYLSIDYLSGTSIDRTLYTVSSGLWKKIDAFSAVYDWGDSRNNRFTVNGINVSESTFMKYNDAYEMTIDNLIQYGDDSDSPSRLLLRTSVMNQLLESLAPSSWAKAEVEAAEKAGLIPELTGDPGWQDASTRLQFCQLAVQLVETALGEELPAAPAGTFSDCSDLAVRKAYAAGIVNGMTATTFAPNQTTNREQIATMVNRAIDYIKDQTGTDLTPLPGSISKFADKDSVSSWAVEGVGALAANGIMNGTSATQLSPQSSCTVEQSVLLSYRTFLKLN